LHEFIFFQFLGIDFPPKAFSLADNEECQGGLNMTFLNRTFSKLALIALLFSSAFVFAADPINNKRGVAVKGYDVVAYFTDSKPMKGDKQYTAEHEGVTWRFANAENRDKFTADPEKYVPQYGGYCAFGVAKGATYNIDPDAWKIVDGKLYLNYNTSVQKDWQKDIPGFIATANKNWPAVLN
jgi:YHS domain-containing protein